MSEQVEETEPVKTKDAEDKEEQEQPEESKDEKLKKTEPVSHRVEIELKSALLYCLDLAPIVCGRICFPKLRLWPNDSQLVQKEISFLDH
jgi:hypothetical protein